MRAMKWVVIGVVALLVVGFILAFRLGGAVKAGVEGFGPKLLGVPVKVAHVKLSLLTGEFRIQGLDVGNPEGFRTDHSFRVGEISVNVAMRSLLSKTIHVRRVYVNAPDIAYEAGLNGSNLGKLLEGMEGEKKPSGTPKEAEKGQKAGKKVLIDDLRVEGGRIRLSAVGLAGNALTIPLPPVHLTDIGKESNGASPVEVIRSVLTAIVGSVKGAVSGAGAVVGKGAQEVGVGVQKAGAAVGKEAGKVVEGVGSLFKKRDK